MAYNITLSNGQPLVTVPDGQVNDTATSLVLVGKNYPGYGKFLNENYAHLLENFANSTEPREPIEGQLWWDTTNKRLSIRANNGWKTVSGSTPTQPSNPVVGDLWWNPAVSKLQVYNGSGWTPVGPLGTAETAILLDTVLESGGGASHTIFKFVIDSTVVGIISKDPSYTISSIPGFSTINPGLNLSSENSLGYYGLVDNANKLGGEVAAHYLRSDVNDSTDGSLTITSNAGLLVGPNQNLTLTTSSNDVKITSTITGKELGLYATVGGTQTKMVWLDGISGKANTLTPTGTDTASTIATKGYVDAATSGASSGALMRDGTNAIIGSILPGTNGAYNLGSNVAAFANVFATNFTGTASNASSLGGVSASNYARLDNAPNAIFTVSPTITANSGVTIGAASDLTINIDAAGANIISNTSNKSLKFSVKVGGVATNALVIDGTSGKASLSVGPTAGDSSLSIATKGYVDSITSSVNLTSVGTNIIPAVGNNNVLNIGSAALKWNTVYATTFNGTSSNALYADLAERFAADAEYAPGTVLTIGGTAEVTAELRAHSDSVFGVVSTKPAYLMNSELGSDKTHPALVLSGKAPVRVIGAVSKGDRLVSAGNGMARAASLNEITAFNVIGRALESSDILAEKLVISFVSINR